MWGPVKSNNRGLACGPHPFLFCLQLCLYSEWPSGHLSLEVNNLTSHLLQGNASPCTGHGKRLTVLYTGNFGVQGFRVLSLEGIGPKKEQYLVPGEESQSRASYIQVQASVPCQVYSYLLFMNMLLGGGWAWKMKLNIWIRSSLWLL